MVSYLRAFTLTLKAFRRQRGASAPLGFAALAAAAFRPLGPREERGTPSDHKQGSPV